MAGRKKAAGVDDNKTFHLVCPRCQQNLDVTNFRTGRLDKMRGVHKVTSYGWIARCPQCERTWGDFMNPMIAPSLWVLKDLVEEKEF